MLNSNLLIKTDLTQKVLQSKNFLTWNCCDALLQLSILAMYKATALMVLLRQSLEQKKRII